MNVKTPRLRTVQSATDNGREVGRFVPRSSSWLSTSLAHNSPCSVNTPFIPSLNESHLTEIYIFWIKLSSPAPLINRQLASSSATFSRKYPISGHLEKLCIIFPPYPSHDIISSNHTLTLQKSYCILLIKE